MKQSCGQQRRYRKMFWMSEPRSVCLHSHYCVVFLHLFSCHGQSWLIGTRQRLQGVASVGFNEPHMDFPNICRESVIPSEHQTSLLFLFFLLSLLFFNQIWPSAHLVVVLNADIYFDYFCPLFWSQLGEWKEAVFLFCWEDGGKTFGLNSRSQPVAPVWKC